MRRSYDLDANAWVRRAADTLSGDVEPGALAPRLGVWSSSPPKPRVWLGQKLPPRQLIIFVGIAAVAVVGLAWLLNFRFTFLLVPLQAMLGVASPSGNSAKPQDRRLLENEEDANVCLVGIAIRRDGKLVGRDRGVVWFSDGGLYFNGHRTSFVIGGQDVIPSEEHRRNRDGQKPSDRVLVLRHPCADVQVEFVPLIITGKGAGTPAEMRFLKRFYDFRRHPTYADVPRQWPPLEL